MKTPLRYPGGKSRAIKFLDTYLPKDFTEFREPFIGGGSVFLYLKAKNPKASYWINDLYYNLFCFWTTLRDNPDDLVKDILDVRKKNTTPNQMKDIFNETKEDINNTEDIFTKGKCFYILNKCSYSGMNETGSFSPTASERNFTERNIKYLSDIAPLLKDVRITNLDYGELLKDEGAFVFLDPPYDITTSKLYGKNGCLHLQFDHLRFFEEVKDCKHDWLITYNFTDKLAERWQEYQQVKWKLKYTMMWKDGKGIDKDELLIYNYCKNIPSLDDFLI